MLNSWIKAATLAAVVLAAASFTNSPARAQAAPVVAPPAAIPNKLAVVNIVQLFDTLDEKVSIDGQIEAMKKSLTNQINDKKADVEKLQKALDSNTFKPDSPDYKKLEDDLLSKSIDLQVFTQVSQKQLLVELTSQKAKLYKKINDAVAAYAQSHDIALVFVADDAPTPGDVETPEALQAQISLRKVMYADARYDITRAIREKMNADFRAATNH